MGKRLEMDIYDCFEFFSTNNSIFRNNHTLKLYTTPCFDIITIVDGIRAGLMCHW